MPLLWVRIDLGGRLERLGVMTRALVASFAILCCGCNPTGQREPQNPSTMTKTFTASSWSMTLPASWREHREGQSVAFEPPDDPSAALTVIALSKPDGSIQMDAMHQAIHSPAHGTLSSSETHLGDFRGYTGAYDSRDENGVRSWRVWCVFRGSTHLYITYNCRVASKGGDDAVIDRMLSTLKATNDA